MASNPAASSRVFQDSGYGGSSPQQHQPASQNLDAAQPLDLSDWPPIFLSATHFDTGDLDELEEELDAAKAVHTYSINEAEIILSKVGQKKRAQFDLRAKGLRMQEWIPQSIVSKKRKHDDIEIRSQQPLNAIVIDDSSTDSEVESAARKRSEKPVRKTAKPSLQRNENAAPGRVVKVVKIEWFKDSKHRGYPLPLDNYITYQGVVEQSTSPQPSVDLSKNKVSNRGTGKQTANPTSRHGTAERPTISSSEILRRAQDDASQASPTVDRFGKRQYRHPYHSTPSANPASWEAGHGTNSKYAHLLQQTTTDNEGSSSDVPEMPEWVKQHVKYACQRLTPKSNPNDPFIELLKEIRLARQLTNDEVGVRAYSTSIAALAAYTYKLSNPREILLLPGCDNKVANLYAEWKNTGKVQAVEDARTDEDLKILRLFFNIWGVGVTTAREFYIDRGWREMDDIIEYGWSTLTRVQQIGVKYYDEFLDLIPRTEVEQICETIRKHAVSVRVDGIQTMIVGGYRRGKEASGDVDIIVSHPDESVTMNLINDLVTSLEEEEWITHTLTLSTTSSDRGQQTLPFRAGGGGHGFDTLDKALVVWQHPTWPTKDQDLADNPKAKNPNIHRRVDIIVSPWRSVGCAVVGWSGGTTFERDLRRYAKNVKGWKFDSSGVRDRGNGEVVDLEGYFSWKGKEGKEARAVTMEEAERRVFEGFGLTYRHPWERCTG